VLEIFRQRKPLGASRTPHLSLAWSVHHGVEFGLRHGGHIIDDEVPASTPTLRKMEICPCGVATCPVTTNISRGMANNSGSDNPLPRLAAISASNQLRSLSSGAALKCTTFSSGSEVRFRRYHSSRRGRGPRY
jgi:hypothetical protein